MPTMIDTCKDCKYSRKTLGGFKVHFIPPNVFQIKVNIYFLNKKI